MIELLKVEKRSKDKEIFKNLNLKINSNDCIGIVRPNGFGKTVLMKWLAIYENI